MIRCILENNHQTSFRHVVVDGLIIDKNKILLVKRVKKLSNPGKYALVGGFVDRDENIAQAMLREVLEETGYKAEIVNLLAIIDNPNRPQEDRQNISFVFILKPIKKIGSHDKEVENTHWFDLDKLPDKDKFAFDHYDIIQKYQTAQAKNIKIPILSL